MNASPDLVNLDSLCLTTREWEELAEKADFNLARMASQSGLSIRHLQRISQRDLHCTPKQWLRELRCRRAKRLIMRGYSSKAAAAELKYATAAHFCREFKKVFGVSPQRFAPNVARPSTTSREV
jgi:AraC-like DNA-binding protein